MLILLLLLIRVLNSSLTSCATLCSVYGSLGLYSANIDFVRVMPGIPKAGVQSRIIVAPEHAKRLLRALEDNIAKYERVFGPIRTSDEPPISPLTGVKGEA